MIIISLASTILIYMKKELFIMLNYFPIVHMSMFMFKMEKNGE